MNKIKFFIFSLCLGLPPFLIAEGVQAPLFEKLEASSKKLEKSYYSQARIEALSLGGGLSLEGFHVFLDGQLVGTSPLELKNILVNRKKVTLSVQKPGYFESVRPALIIPRDGIVDIAVLSTRPTRTYTVPSFIGGIALMSGSLVAYAQPKGESVGLGMLVGGLVLVGVTQIVSRWIHLPALKRKLRRQNRRHLEANP